jgi:tRNA pseudouridine38-40 synthase
LILNSFQYIKSPRGKALRKSDYIGINIKMIVSYEGTSFFGWQKTSFGPSIEEALEKALFAILRFTPSLQAASRTDRGVHAQGQVVNFFLPKKVDLLRLCYQINSLLPASIRILSLEEADPSFHPTLDARSKEYHYFLSLSPEHSPFHQRFSWHIPTSLNIALMEEAACLFIGRKDCSALTTEACAQPFCTLESIQIKPLIDQRLSIQIKGDRFLYKMARCLVGSLVALAKGNLSLTQVASALKQRERSKMGPTAPPQGLFLHRIDYFCS